jgi:hypothetical protein
MQTTLDLPEDVVRRLERRAAHDGRTVEQVAADLLTAVLPPDDESSPAQVVPKHLPLIRAKHLNSADARAVTGQAWVDLIKELESQDEVERYEKALGHQHVGRTDG